MIVSRYGLMVLAMSFGYVLAKVNDPSIFSANNFNLTELRNSVTGMTDRQIATMFPFYVTHAAGMPTWEVLVAAHAAVIYECDDGKVYGVLGINRWVEICEDFSYIPDEIRSDIHPTLEQVMLKEEAEPIQDIDPEIEASVLVYAREYVINCSVLDAALIYSQ